MNRHIVEKAWKEFEEKERSLGPKELQVLKAMFYLGFGGGIMHLVEHVKNKPAGGSSWIKDVQDEVTELLVGGKHANK